MKALIILISSFTISLIIIRLYKKEYKFPLAGRIAMASMLLFTATGHFLFPEGMAAMIPGFFPFKQFTVVFTGVLEIIFAIGLLTYRDQKTIGSIIVIFFILIVPANIYAAIEGVNYQTGELDGPGVTYLWFRIPLQVLFVIWTYLTTIKGSLKTKSVTSME
ncbi:MAG: hypothetical protein AAF616_13035 [Bacteroidota bacterium]